MIEALNDTELVEEYEKLIRWSKNNTLDTLETLKLSELEAEIEARLIDVEAITKVLEEEGDL